MIYFDTSYLVRLYLSEPGSNEVRDLAKNNEVHCALHGRTEVLAAFHRVFREGRITRPFFLEIVEQFCDDEREGAVAWISSGDEIFQRAEKIYRTAGAEVFLRAADAMHLACAAENGFREIYSNDRHLLAAAALFGLKPKNVIA
jgi:predicted nucleic acid-binding protein